MKMLRDNFDELKKIYEMFGRPYPDESQFLILNIEVRILTDGGVIEFHEELKPLAPGSAFIKKVTATENSQ